MALPVHAPHPDDVRISHRCALLPQLDLARLDGSVEEADGTEPHFVLQVCREQQQEEGGVMGGAGCHCYMQASLRWQEGLAAVEAWAVAV
jgi:hypothetical protein